MGRLLADTRSYNNYMAKKYELYNKGAKEVTDVKFLDMNLKQAKVYFYMVKQFPDKNDFERLYEVRQKKPKAQSPFKF